MSEFIEYPVERSLSEVIGDTYDRVRTFAGEVLARAEIFPVNSDAEMWIANAEPVKVEQQDQRGSQGQQKPPHTCGSSCSRCGHGGSQTKKPGLR